MHKATTLYRLQQIDLQIDRLNKHLVHLRSQLDEPASLLADRERFAAIQEQSHNVDTQLLDAELATRSLGNKIATVEKALYSGQVSNPKEIASQQENVISMKKHLAVLEEKQLDLMLQNEQLEAQLRQAQHALQEATAQWHETLSRVIAEIKATESSLAELQTRRQSEANRVAPADLQLYQRIRNRKGGIAVAKLENGRCSVCGISLPESKQHAVQYQDDFVFCGSCGRILSP